MKIAIIMSGQAFEAGAGVRLQGIMWAEGLRNLGHQVELINFWGVYEWNEFDIAIVLQFGGLFEPVINTLKKYRLKIVVAPIIDPHRSLFLYKVLCKWLKCDLLKLYSAYNKFYEGCKKTDFFLTRSSLETHYLSYCCDVAVDKIKIVPLSVRFSTLDHFPDKQNFCLHVSRLYSSNKNVERLIQAAKKYKFQLVLAGFLNGKDEEQWLNAQICDCPNIEYVGALSDSELIEYYKKAKVFALPSLNEGVGMVAMEAAAFGCEIVLTNIGAPKEYWDGQAYLVNPYSVDSIGNGIMECLKNGFSQPKLMDYIDKQYSFESCSKKLEETLANLLNN